MDNIALQKSSDTTLMLFVFLDAVLGDLADVHQVSEIFIVVQSVPNHELVWNIKTGTCLYRSCAALAKFSGHLDKSQGKTGIDFE